MSSLTSDFKRVVIQSAAGHLFFVAAVLLIVNSGKRTESPVDFEVIQNPVASDAARPVQIEKPKSVEKKAEKRGVFGLTKTSLTEATDSSAPSVKLGNTVAKENDKEKLRDDDAASLPVPTDEYLISEMPKLLGEVKIAYPEEAKKAGVQGPVFFDLLIDADGKVREAVLVRGPGFGLNEAAAVAVKGFRFSPARVQEKPVAVRIRYAYRFVLQK
jgi:periplasmic protein TonB